MKPYYEHAGITIYHGDCRDVLPDVAAVDLVLVDPVYGVAYETAWRSRTDKLRTALHGDATLNSVAEAWPLAIAALRDDRHWYAFASPRMVAQAAAIFEGFKHIIAWDKGDRGTVGDLEAGYGEAWEALFYGMKGRRPLNGPRPRTIERLDWSSTCDPVHPTVKPVKLLERYICRSSEVDETVLDFMAGSGTTLRAAKNVGRKAIGIEIKEEYCEIAANRLAQEVLF